MAINSPVYTAFQANFDRLANSVKPAVGDVARKAFEKNLITSQNLSNAQNPMHPEDYRSTTLLLQILGKVKENPTHFDTFVSILKSIPVLRDIGDELNESVYEYSSSVTESTHTERSGCSTEFISPRKCDSHNQATKQFQPQPLFGQPLKLRYLSHPMQPLITRYMASYTLSQNLPVHRNDSSVPYIPDTDQPPVSQKDPKADNTEERTGLVSNVAANETSAKANESSLMPKQDESKPSSGEVQPTETVKALSDRNYSTKEAFKCPCCGCTLSAYLKDECPGVATEHNQFPYLDLKRLDSASKINLQTKLFADTENIIQKFADLLSSVKKSLKQNNVDPEDVAISALSVSAMGPGRARIPLLKDCENKLLSSRKISQIFLILMPYLSFFNHEILQQIIKDLGTEDDKKMFQNYLSFFKQFCKRSVFEVPPTVYTQAAHNPEQRKMLAVKLSEASTDITLAHVLSARYKFAKTVGLDPASLFLCHIEKGCVKLTFTIPIFAADILFPLSCTSLEFLSFFGISPVFDPLPGSSLRLPLVRSRNPLTQGLPRPEYARSFVLTFLRHKGYVEAQLAKLNVRTHCHKTYDDYFKKIISVYAIHEAEILDEATRVLTDYLTRKYIFFLMFKEISSNLFKGCIIKWRFIWTYLMYTSITVSLLIQKHIDWVEDFIRWSDLLMQMLGINDWIEEQGGLESRTQLGKESLIKQLSASITDIISGIRVAAKSYYAELSSLID